MIEAAPKAQVDIATIPQVSSDYTDVRHLVAQMFRANKVGSVLQLGMGNGDFIRICSALMQEIGGQVWVSDNKPGAGNWLKDWPAKNVTVWQAEPLKLDWRQKVDVLVLHDLASYEMIYCAYPPILVNVGPATECASSIMTPPTVPADHSVGTRQILVVAAATTTTIEIPMS